MSLDAQPSYEQPGKNKQVSGWATVIVALVSVHFARKVSRAGNDGQVCLAAS